MNKLSDAIKRKYGNTGPPKGSHWIDCALWPLARQASENKGQLLLNIGSMIGQQIRWRIKWIKSKGGNVSMDGRKGSFCGRVVLPASRRRRRHATYKDVQKGFGGKTRLQFTFVRACAYALVEMERDAGIPLEETEQFIRDLGMTSNEWFCYKFMRDETPWFTLCLVWTLFLPLVMILQAGHGLTTTHVYPLTSAKSP